MQQIEIPILIILGLEALTVCNRVRQQPKGRVIHMLSRPEILTISVIEKVTNQMFVNQGEGLLLRKEEKERKKERNLLSRKENMHGLSLPRRNLMRR